MAVFWLLATQHCGLEGAGLLSLHCETAEGVEGCATDTGHAADGCEMVESGNYKSGINMLKAPAPQFVAQLCVVCVPALVPVLAPAEPAASRAYAERPRDWVPVWRFVQRTALAPRAPSLA